MKYFNPKTIVSVTFYPAKQIDRRVPVDSISPSAYCRRPEVVRVDIPPYIDIVFVNGEVKQLKFSTNKEAQEKAEELKSLYELVKL